MVETENLLKRLKISSSQFQGVLACPEGRPVVLIILDPTVDASKFLYLNESYIVKEGVRTTSIRPEGKKEKVVKVTGLHPNTKDRAVIKYLSAHGDVSSTDKVIHHVFPGEPGSSLCAGKLNGNRSYVVELKVPMGSYHIIDGEKVSVRYGGQEWTCARCHQFKRDCPGQAVARECTADRVLLSAHMVDHWEKLGYKPDTDNLNEVDGVQEPEVQVGGKDRKILKIPESSLTGKYQAVIMRGFRKDSALDDLLEVLVEHGLPGEYRKEDISRNDKTGTISIENLKPEECLLLVEKMNGKRILSRQIYVTPLVANSPTKPAIKSPSKPSPDNPETLNSSSKANPQQQQLNKFGEKPLPHNLGKLLTPRPTPNQANNDSNSSSDTSAASDDLDLRFNFEPESPSEQSSASGMTALANKRKSEGSPETCCELSRKEKKILREMERKEKKNMKKQEQKASRTLGV